MGVAFSVSARRAPARIARPTWNCALVSAWLAYEAAYDDWPVKVQA
jgi:hypothetical protein